MPREYIDNDKRQRIGYIETSGTRRQAFDNTGKRLGDYDAARNETSTAAGRREKGDTLRFLILQDDAEKRRKAEDAEREKKRRLEEAERQRKLQAEDAERERKRKAQEAEFERKRREDEAERRRKQQAEEAERERRRRLEEAERQRRLQDKAALDRKRKAVETARKAELAKEASARQALEQRQREDARKLAEAERASQALARQAADAERRAAEERRRAEAADLARHRAESRARVTAPASEVDGEPLAGRGRAPGRSIARTGDARRPPRTTAPRIGAEESAVPKSRARPHREIVDAPTHSYPEDAGKPSTRSGLLFVALAGIVVLALAGWWVSGRESKVSTSEASDVQSQPGSTRPTSSAGAGSAPVQSTPSVSAGDRALSTDRSGAAVLVLLHRHGRASLPDGALSTLHDAEGNPPDGFCIGSLTVLDGAVRFETRRSADRRVDDLTLDVAAIRKIERRDRGRLRMETRGRGDWDFFADDQTIAEALIRVIQAQAP